MKAGFGIVFPKMRMPNEQEIDRLRPCVRHAGTACSRRGSFGPAERSLDGAQYRTRKGGVMRIRLDEVHYEIAHRYEVNTGPMCIFPSGFSFDESISAYYENVHGYRLMVTRTMDGKMSFTSDFPRGTSEAYTSLGEAKDSESYKGCGARAAHEQVSARGSSAFVNPSKAKRQRDVAEVFATIEHALQDNTLTEKIEGESKND